MAVTEHGGLDREACDVWFDQADVASILRKHGAKDCVLRAGLRFASHRPVNSGQLYTTQIKRGDITESCGL